MRSILIVFLVLATTASRTGAWNATGHRVIASIAFRQLGAEEQASVVEALRRHPRFAQDFAEQMPSEVRDAEPAAQHEWLFQQAAVWPDTVRFGPEEKRAFHRSEWHYINLPVFLISANQQLLTSAQAANVVLTPPENAKLDTARMNIVQVIELARRELVGNRASPEERALWLAWLFHDVGDLHQPLHSSALYSVRLFPEGDRGGNSVKLRQAGNLHSLWDQFLGSDDAYRATRNKALALIAKEELAAAGGEAAMVLVPETWARESHELGKSTVYNPEVMSALRGAEQAGGEFRPLNLSESYLKAGGSLTEELIVKAGYRLAGVIKQTNLARRRQ